VSLETGVHSLITHGRCRDRESDVVEEADFDPKLAQDAPLHNEKAGPVGERCNQTYNKNG
jgi:hypothetical protein